MQNTDDSQPSLPLLRQGGEEVRDYAAYEGWLSLIPAFLGIPGKNAEVCFNRPLLERALLERPGDLAAAGTDQVGA